jgi:allantoinase
MDTIDRIPYCPIPNRPRLTWPNGERLAVWIAPNIEHYDFIPPPGQKRHPWPPRVPHPDVREYSYRDYGNRVGFWRLLSVLDAFDVPVTASLNLGVPGAYPEIAAAIREREWAIMSHGLYNTRYLYDYTEAEEEDFLRQNIDLTSRHFGRELLGMLGPAISSTTHTPDLLAAAGLLYHCDWAHDDQPTPLRVESGRLISVPYSFQLADGPVALGARGGEYFQEVCQSQFDTLYQEGEESGRVLAIALHPFRIGQPHMIDYLKRVLDYFMGHEHVWWATADDIARYYLDVYYDEAVRHLEDCS